MTTTTGKRKPPNPSGPKGYPPTVRARAVELARMSSIREAGETMRADGWTMSDDAIREWCAAAGVTPGNLMARLMPMGAAAAAGTPAKGLGEAVAGRLDPLVRRILAARCPEALDELEAGLAEAARGEAALEAWLAAGAEEGEDEIAPEVDPLDALKINLGRLTKAMRNLPKGRANASLYNAVSNTSKAIESITLNRPRAPTVDEVTSRIEAKRDEAVKKILEHTGEARRGLEERREGLAQWAAANLGPVQAEEVRRRVGEMLGDVVRV